MWCKIISSVVLLCLILKNVQCQKNFVVAGSQTMSYQDKYSVLVISSGYTKSENLEIKIIGKLNDGTRYQNNKAVMLSLNRAERVEFDLAAQKPGNYFINVKTNNFNETKKLNLNKKKFSVLVQTDKSIYKPGDKVQFRILLLNGDLKPYAAKNVDVYITDATSNRIKQFDKVAFIKGVANLDLQLSKEPVLGVWGINVILTTESVNYVKNFEVAQYVLPKFDIALVTKSKISSNEDIVVSFSAKYTYGKDVEGTAVVTAESVYYWWARKVEKTLTNSTKTVSFNLKKDLNLDVTWTQTIRITIVFTEALTLIERKATTTVTVYSNPYLIEVRGSDNFIKPGLQFTATAFVKDINEVPITDATEAVTFRVTYTLDTLENSYWWWQSYETVTSTYTKFLKNGIAEIPIIVTSNVTFVEISSSYKGSYGYMYVPTNPTESNQYIEIRVPVDVLSSTKSTQIEMISNVNINRMNYIIFGKNRVAASGQLNSLNTKSFKINLLPTVQMIPTAKMIAFYVTKNGEIISDSKVLNFNNELRNFVNLTLSSSETKPNSTVNITIASRPLSFVGLLGIDQSVLLLKSGNDIDINMITGELNSYLPVEQYNYDWQEPISYSSYKDFTAMDSIIFTNSNPEYVRPQPSYSMSSEYTMYSEAASSAESSFLAPSSEASSEAFSEALPSSEAQASSEESIPSGGSGAGTPAAREIPTRKNFPETWLFENIDNIRGTTTISRQVPDTITSWIITGFSMNPTQGLGMTKEASKLRVFMPFFIYLNLPYSIKRGEIIALQAIIFNYMNADYPATITMFNDKQEFQFMENTASQLKLVKNINTKSSSGTSVRFIIKALKVGYITLKMEATVATAGDKIEQLLLVEPEGIKKYNNEAFLVDLRTSTTFKKTVDIVVPPNYVNDSLWIEASFIGDLLGPTIDNLGNLIKMPYGCGEQNMLNFVPNIIILDYLTNANKLTPATKAKLINYMEIGYQKELTYKRYDGSFSAFGSYDSAGSTWLTAFVARSFNQASKYITIDSNAINNALNYLENVQNSDGSFSELGIVHNKAMQGGSSNGIGLTAYVLLTFLENQQFITTYSETINRAKNNILSNILDVDDVYVLAIASYALYLADESSAADIVVENLDLQVNTSNGMRHWDRMSEGYYIKSLSVETSAYAALAYLEAGRDGDAMLITRWLISQRNNAGGFASTQDTIVGLLALSKIASIISSSISNIKVDLKYQTTVKTININQKNALVLQKVEIPSTVRSVEISANGSGSALAQVSYQYNINDLEKSDIINLIVNLITDLNYSLILEVCVGVEGIDQSNMAVMEISTPSGYVFEDGIEYAIYESNDNIKRMEYDRENTFAYIYFDFIRSTMQCIQVKTVKSFDVADQKPASVVVYDYYENAFRTEVFYTPKKVLLCEICNKIDCSNTCK